MIVSVDAAVDFTALLEDQIPVNPFACRISSLFRSYAPTYSFVDYWLQTSDDGIVTGAIARYGADYIVSLTEDSDSGEVSSFLEMAGASSVLCSDKTLSLELQMQSGWILTRRLPFAGEKQRFVSPDLREAFALLQSCAEKDFQPPSFADFYVDVSHKARHGCIRLCGITHGERLAAMAMTVAESPSCAVIGAVACHPAWRGNGYGSAVVRQLVNELTAQGKQVFLHRAQDKNEQFYGSLGFTTWGRWREYRTE